jgi:hypothetical protein
MKTKDKHYIKTVHEKNNCIDPKTKTKSCTVCPRGVNCPHAHNAIQLDLIPLNQSMKNL